MPSQRAGRRDGLLLGGMLTEWASWRWVMHVNAAFADPALRVDLAYLTIQYRTI